MSEELNICKLDLLDLVNQIEFRLHQHRELGDPNLTNLDHIKSLIDTAMCKVIDIGVYLEPASQHETYVSLEELIALNEVVTDRRFVIHGDFDHGTHMVAPLALNTVNKTIIHLQYDTPELEDQLIVLRDAIQMEFGIS